MTKKTKSKQSVKNYQKRNISSTAGRKAKKARHTFKDMSLSPKNEHSDSSEISFRTAHTTKSCEALQNKQAIIAKKKEIGKNGERCQEDKEEGPILKMLRKKIKEGASMRELAEDHPQIVLRYGSGVLRLRQHYRPERNGPPEIWVLWGKT